MAVDRALLVSQIPGLRRYARALTGDAWAADDLVQDTLERACSKWRLWAVGTDLRAWLFTLMHNTNVNQIRAAMRRPAGSRSVDIDELADELPGAGGEPSLALDLQRCLLRLPEDQRAVLLLVSVEDLSYEEVSQVLGVPMGTVMSRLSRARARLRELMEGAAERPVARQAGSAPALRRLK